MKYVEIKKNLDPKVSGIREGVSQAHINDECFVKSPWLKDFLYGTESGYQAGEIPSEIPAIDQIILNKKAKLNDFISVGAILDGFFVNEKVQSILQGCNLPPHRFYPVTFDQQGTIIESYSWFYFNLIDGKKWVDYEKSLFDLAVYEFRFKQKFFINSYQDMVEFARITGRFPFAKRIVFTREFDCELDWFGLKIISTGNYISGRLKEKLEKNKVIGYQTYQIHDPILEWQ